MESKDVIEKLYEMNKLEKKRKSKAVDYINQLVEVLSPAISEAYGVREYDNEAIFIPEYNETTKSFSMGYTDLYFRYGKHEGINDVEYPGFYINPLDSYWGQNLIELKGKNFWKYINQILIWLTIYLPDEFEFIEKYEEQSFYKIDSIINLIKNVNL